MKQPFIYTTSLIKLKPEGTGTGIISITREADFNCLRFLSSQEAPFTFHIRDSAYDRLWSNQPLHSDVIPQLKSSYLIKRCTTVTIDITNLSPHENVVQFVLEGEKIYESENTGWAS